jgi:hypothetical protein
MGYRLYKRGARIKFVEEALSVHVSSAMDPSQGTRPLDAELPAAPGPTGTRSSLAAGPVRPSRGSQLGGSRSPRRPGTGCSVTFWETRAPAPCLRRSPDASASSPTVGTYPTSMNSTSYRSM